MKQSDHFRESAESCAQLAERATEEATHDRYRRMEAAWRALAEEQDLLDGEVPRQKSRLDEAAESNNRPQDGKRRCS